MSALRFRKSTLFRLAVGSAALAPMAGPAWAHSGHAAGEYVLGVSLHAWFGIHGAVVEPLLMLAAVAAVARVAGWVAARVSAWRIAPRRAG